MIIVIEQVCIEPLGEGMDGGGRPYVEWQTVPRSGCSDAKSPRCNEPLRPGYNQMDLFGRAEYSCWYVVDNKLVDLLVVQSNLESQRRNL